MDYDIFVPKKSSVDVTSIKVKYEEREDIVDECLKDRPKLKISKGVKIWGQKTVSMKDPIFKKGK